MVRIMEETEVTRTATPSYRWYLEWMWKGHRGGAEEQKLLENTEFIDDNSAEDVLLVLRGCTVLKKAPPGGRK